ncbi:MAG: endonuclease NucS domain-containing protein [Terriglobia bacterium]
MPKQEGNASTFAEALRESLESLVGVRNKREIASWIQQHYPDRWKAGTLSGHLYGCSVNNPKAVQHHPGFPRFLFSLGNGRYELYDPDKHGVWENGTPAGEQPEQQSEAGQAESTESNSAAAFAYEEHLRDYLARNLHILEPALTLWNGSELESVEFAIEGRRIDILAKDTAGIPVVVELKVSRGHERTIGQCLYYRAKIKEIMKVGKVRIFIVAQEISPELKLAAQEVPDVSLFEYSLSMTVRRV